MVAPPDNNRSSLPLETRSSLLLEDVHSRKRYPISAGTTFGRTEAEHRFPDDALLSRKHFRIWVDAGKILIQDLGSRNRTRVNGTPVATKHPQEIKPGDEVTAGKLRLVVKDLDLPFVPAMPAVAEIKCSSGKITAAHLAGLLPRPVQKPLGLFGAARAFFTAKRWNASNGLVVSLTFAFFVIPELAEIIAFESEGELPHSPANLVLRLAGVVALGAVPIWIFQYWISRRFLNAGWSRLASAGLAIAALFVTSSYVGTMMGYDQKYGENRIYAACVDARSRTLDHCRAVALSSGPIWENLPAHLRNPAEIFRAASENGSMNASAPPPANPSTTNDANAPTPADRVPASQ